jgi:hypothetical protein
VTAIVHMRGSFDKDEIEGLRTHGLSNAGQASCPKEAIDAEMHLEQEFCT